MSEASEGISNVQYKPTTIADAGGHNPITVRRHNNAQAIVYHYWIAELSFELKPRLGNQRL